MIFDYSHWFDGKINLFLTQSDQYWDKGYPISRKEKITQYFNFKDKKIVIPEQIHSDIIANVSSQSDNLVCDSIIYSSTSNIVGVINVADCVPVCIYDCVNNYIALVHSGWKGTHKKITVKTIERLEAMGSRKSNLKVFLGPSIKGCCYQVEDYFASQFDRCSIINKEDSFFVDLSLQIKFDLESTGIPTNNINISKICTYDNDNCHSFRRDAKQSGRMSFIAFKN